MSEQLPVIYHGQVLVLACHQERPRDPRGHPTTPHTLHGIEEGGYLWAKQDKGQSTNIMQTLVLFLQIWSLCCHLFNFKFCKQKIVTFISTKGWAMFKLPFLSFLSFRFCGFCHLWMTLGIIALHSTLKGLQIKLQKPSTRLSQDWCACLRGS